MKHSESMAKLAAALVNAQGMIEGARKDSANPYFKSKYADLNSCWRACREALQENGLAVAQFPVSTEYGVGVDTILMHSSGEWMSEQFVLPFAASKVDAQAGGSCITYARRYALCAVMGICPEDDDGNAATDSITKVRQEGLKILNEASKKGEDGLKMVWSSMSENMRRVCLADKNKILAGIKEGNHAPASV